MTEISINILLEKITKKLKIVSYLKQQQKYDINYVMKLSVNYAISVLCGNSKCFNEWYSNKIKSTFDKIVDNLLDNGLDILNKNIKDLQIILEHIDYYILDLEKCKNGVFYEELEYIAENYTKCSIENPNLKFNQWYIIYNREKRINKIRKIINRT